MIKQFASLELKEHIALFRIVSIGEDAEILSDTLLQYDISLVRIDAPVSKLFADEIDIFYIQGVPYLFGPEASEISDKGYIDILSLRGDRVSVEHTLIQKEKAYEILLEHMAALALLLLKKLWDRLDDSAPIEYTEISFVIPASPPSEFCLERFYLNNIDLHKIAEYDTNVYTAFAGEWNSIVFEEQPTIWKLFSEGSNTLFVEFESLFSKTFESIFDYDDSSEQRSQDEDCFGIPPGFDHDSYVLFQIMKNIEDTSQDEADRLKDKISYYGIFGDSEKIGKEDEIVQQSIKVLNSHLATTLDKTLKSEEITVDRIILYGKHNALLSSKDVDKINNLAPNEKSNLENSLTTNLNRGYIPISL